RARSTGPCSFSRAGVQTSSSARLVSGAVDRVAANGMEQPRWESSWNEAMEPYGLFLDLLILCRTSTEGNGIRSRKRGTGERVQEKVAKFAALVLSSCTDPEYPQALVFMGYSAETVLDSPHATRASAQ